MKIKLFNWYLFLFYRMRSEADYMEYAGEYLFDICIQTAWHEKRYLTGIKIAGV